MINFRELSKKDYVLAYCLEPGYGIIHREDAEEDDYSRPVFHSECSDEVARVWDLMKD